MKRAVGLALALAVFLQSTPSWAAFKGCYERVYDAHELKKHRKQRVVKMRFQFGVGKGIDGPFELLDRIDAGFRTKPVYRGNLVECKAADDALTCAIEGDGGSFTVIDRGENSLRITNQDYMRFGEDVNGTELKADAENTEFRLYRISTEACP